MSLRERVLTILAVVAVVGVVVYPLAHRISTSQASASVAPASAFVATAPPPSPSPEPTLIAPSAPPVVILDDRWSATAEDHRGANGETFTYVCPADGTPGLLWGSLEYTDDSSVCTAAVHTGVITFEDGGTIDIVILPGAESYEGSKQNGVESTEYEAWPGSFAVVAPAR